MSSSSRSDSMRGLINPCKDQDESGCARYNRSCRWQNTYTLRGKEIPASCRKRGNRSKSPKKAKSPKRAKSPKKAKSPSKCRALKARACGKAVGCAWVKEHKGRNDKMIPSMCRGVRVSKKSPKKAKSPKRSPSRCSKKRKAECVDSPSCNWVKGYKNAVSGKRVSGLCRRKASPSRSVSRSRSSSR